MLTAGASESAAKPGHTKINYLILLLPTIYKNVWLIPFGAWFTLLAGVVNAYRTTVRKRPHQRLQVPRSQVRRGEEKILAQFAPPRLHRRPHDPACLRRSWRLQPHAQ